MKKEGGREAGNCSKMVSDSGDRCLFVFQFCRRRFSVFLCRHQLKVLTNEKKGGLEVVAFDRFLFKLFTLRFSVKSVQVPSSERFKTTQRILFLSFEIYNCLQITASGCDILFTTYT
jgi:hypothetical protein